MTNRSLSTAMKTIIAIVLIAALGGTSAGLWFHFNPRQHELRLPGTVESQEVRLSSRVGGRVSKVYVDDGAVLEAGAKVIELEMPELDAQRAQLVAQKQAAEAVLAKLIEGPRKQEIAAAKAAVDAAQARLDLMHAGFRPEETEQVAGDLASARAELANARTDMERERNLLAQKATSQGNFDAAVAKYGRLNGQVAALDAKHRMYSKGYREQE